MTAIYAKSASLRGGWLVIDDGVGTYTIRRDAIDLVRTSTIPDVTFVVDHYRFSLDPSLAPPEDFLTWVTGVSS